MFGGTRGVEAAWDPFLSLLSSKKTPVVRKGVLHHSDTTPLEDSKQTNHPLTSSVSIPISNSPPASPSTELPTTITTSNPRSSSACTTPSITISSSPSQLGSSPPSSSISTQTSPLHSIPSSSENQRPACQIVDEIVPILFAADTLEKSKIDEFNAAMRGSEGRERFGRALNIQRANGMCIPKATFEQLSELLQTALTEADVHDDYRSGKSLMHMGSTFYRTLDGVHEHLSSRLKNLEIWKKIRFWEEALYETLLDERERSSSKDWQDMTVEEQQDQILRDRNTIFGLLGSFSYNMLSYGVVDATVKRFIDTQCKINLLSNDQKQMLLVNTQAMSLSLREVETIISQKLQKEAQKRKKWEASKRKQERFRAARDKLGEMGIAIGSPTERGKGGFSVHRRKQQVMQQIVEHKRISQRLSLRGIGLAGKSIATASAITGTSPLRKTWEKAENTQMIRKAALMGSYKPRGNSEGPLIKLERKEKEVSPENKVVHPVSQSRIGDLAMEVLSAIAPATEKLAKLIPSESLDWLSNMSSPAASMMHFLRSSSEGEDQLGTSLASEHSTSSSSSSVPSSLLDQQAGLSFLANSPSSLLLSGMDPQEKISPEVAAAAVTMKAQISVLTAKILGRDQPFDQEEDDEDDEYDEEGGDDDSDNYFDEDFDDLDYEENEGPETSEIQVINLQSPPSGEVSPPVQVGSFVDPSKIVEWIVPTTTLSKPSSPATSTTTTPKLSRRGQPQSISMYETTNTTFPTLSSFISTTTTETNPPPSPSLSIPPSFMSTTSSPNLAAVSRLSSPPTQRSELTSETTSPRRPSSASSGPTLHTLLETKDSETTPTSKSLKLKNSNWACSERSFTNPPLVDRSQLGMLSLKPILTIGVHHQLSSNNNNNNSSGQIDNTSIKSTTTAGGEESNNTTTLKWTAAGATHLHPQVGLLGTNSTKQRWQPRRYKQDPETTHPAVVIGSPTSDHHLLGARRGEPGR